MQSKVPESMRPQIGKAAMTWFVTWQGIAVGGFQTQSKAKTFAKAIRRLVAYLGSANGISLSGMTSAMSQAVSQSAVNAGYIPNANVGP